MTVSIFSISLAIAKWAHSLVAVILPAIRLTKVGVFILSITPKESQP